MGKIFRVFEAILFGPELAFAGGAQEGGLEPREGNGWSFSGPNVPRASDQDVTEAEDEQRRQALRRNGVRQTLLAGDTDGYAPADAGKKSLLG